MRLLDVASMMKHSLPDRPRDTEWIKGVCQMHINLLESDMLQTGQFIFGSPPITPFFASRPFSDRLGGRTDSRKLKEQQE